MNKAYNSEWVRNIRLQDIAESWLGKKLISSDQLSSIKGAFPENFYRPGIFVKIGLFIFGTIACSFCSGFLSLFILAGFEGDGGISAVSILSAIGFIAMLEFLIRDRKLFHSGVDNALLYAALGATMVPFFMLMNNPPVWLSCCFALALLVPAFLRYADMFTAVACFAVLVFLLANMMMKFPLGAALLPFGIMFFSALSYFLNRRVVSDYYTNCQAAISVLCLAGFYVGGNYYVVREGNALLNDLIGAVSPQIAFAPLFYVFTVLIPIAYVAFGLKTKDRTLLITGLITFAFSIYTYKYYFSQLPIEQGITILGMAMILLAAALIHYLKTPKTTITDEKDGERKLANFEALIAAQHLGQVPAEKGVEFGGGSFGGGGAGNDY
jgi:uncharacterized membrane protein YgcG